MVACALAVLLGASSDAQDAPKAKPPGDATVIVSQADEKKFPEITLTFEVKAADGTRILDAKREDFRILEDDKPVAITKFVSPISRESFPTTIVLVLDRSLSMNEDDRIGGLRRAVSAFLTKLPKGSRVAVVAFHAQVDLICPFTDDPERVRAAVNAMELGQATRFYDGVLEAVELLAKQDGRRAIVAMTDGDDNGSQVGDLDSCVAAAIRAGLPVHTVAFGGEDQERAKELRELVEQARGQQLKRRDAARLRDFDEEIARIEARAKALRDLAEKTRGQAFAARDSDRLRDIFEEIARSGSESYSASYVTDRPIQDGTLRPIKVAYARSANVGEAAVYIPGMVAPKAGWSLLFLGLVAGLGTLWLLPSLLRR